MRAHGIDSKWSPQSYNNKILNCTLTARPISCQSESAISLCGIAGKYFNVSSYLYLLMNAYWDLIFTAQKIEFH